MSRHVHGDTCDCGKNGSAFAHGAIVDPRNPGRVLKPMPCDQVEEIRQRVAADITRESMGRWERFTAHLQGRAGTYTPEAYEAASVSRGDLTAQQEEYWSSQEQLAAQVGHADGAAR